MKTLAAIAVLGLAAAANAQITAVDLGTGAPPATVGPYNMLAFGDDTRAVFGNEVSIDVAEGAPFGPISFDSPMSHREIGNGWATWSHGYGGDVYYNNGDNNITISMPANTGAFYFYAEPDPFDVFNITATADDGATLTLAVNGSSGANGFGFWTAGAPIVSVTVSSDVGFAVGEFGLARSVPTPGAVALLGLGGLVGVRRRR